MSKLIVTDRQGADCPTCGHKLILGTDQKNTTILSPRAAEIHCRCGHGVVLVLSALFVRAMVAELGK